VIIAYRLFRVEARRESIGFGNDAKKCTHVHFSVNPAGTEVAPSLWKAARAPLGLVSFALERMVFPPCPEPLGPWKQCHRVSGNVGINSRDRKSVLDRLSNHNRSNGAAWWIGARKGIVGKLSKADGAHNGILSMVEGAGKRQNEGSPQV